MRRGGNRARHGDFLTTDDRTGLTVWNSETVKQWDGLRVHRSHAETRHPQELIRAPRERTSVPDPRPPPVDAYIGALRTEITTAGLAGDLTIAVLHTERFLAGDRIGVFLTGGDLHRAVVQAVSSTTALLLTAPLPGSVPLGGTVTNYTAHSPSSLES